MNANGVSILKYGESTFSIYENIRKNCDKYLLCKGDRFAGLGIEEVRKP